MSPRFRGLHVPRLEARACHGSSIVAATVVIVLLDFMLYQC